MGHKSTATLNYLDRQVAGMFVRMEILLMDKLAKKEIQRLSSGCTIVNKVVFPAIWLTVFGIGAVVVLIGVDPKAMSFELKIIFPFMWLFGLVLMLVFCFPLKHVTLDSSSLHIRGLMQEIEIPLTEVVSVSGSFLQNPETITLALRHPTIFGQKIKFMPKQRFFRFTTHPTIRLLRDLIDSAN
jgi:hypothetical protein